MTLSQMYEMLQMDGPEDFQYFEQLADLLETEEPIEFDILYTVLSAVPAEDIGELIENYFDEMVNALPDEENEIVSLVDSISQNLLLLAADVEQEKVRAELVHQLEKFRGWYHDKNGVLADGMPLSVFEAVTQCREDRLCGTQTRFTFDNCLGYDLDDASISLGGFEKIDV